MKIIKIVVLTLAVVISPAAYGLTAEEFDPFVEEEEYTAELQTPDSPTDKKEMHTDDGRMLVIELPGPYIEDEDLDWPQRGGA
jgi:hypothetical protein